MLSHDLIPRGLQKDDNSVSSLDSNHVHKENFKEIVR